MTEPSFMDINAVLRQLPHRYPFLLVDRVLECTPGQEHPRDQERHVQRAVLHRALPASAGDAGRHDHRGAGAGGRHPRVRHRGRHARREARASSSSASTRRAFASRWSPATSSILKAELQRTFKGIWRFSTVAEVDGEEVASAEMMVAPEAHELGRIRGSTEHDRSARGDRPDGARSPRMSRSGRSPSSARRSAIGPGCRIGPHAVVHGPDTARCATTRCSSSPRSAMRRRTRSTRASRPDSRSATGNTFREYCTVNRGTTHGGGVTRIGSDNWFMAYTHVAHDCQIGDHCILANFATLGGHVELGDWVIMAGFSGVHQFCKVGAHCFHRQQHRGDARRAAIPDGDRAAGRSRTASMPKASSAVASRQSRSATSATPTGCCIAPD